MARMMWAIRSGAAGVAMALWASAAMAAPVPQDAQQVSSDDREAPEDYGWIDRADALWDAIGDAPPDYSFAFDDGESRDEPWAWETADGYWIVVEDTPEGMRSYYFEPNAEGPFLVREAEYSFGYDDGDVAMVYDAGGGALPQVEGAGHFDEGAALYERGVALRRAVRQRNWQPVNTTAWVDVSFVLIGLQHQWDEGRLRHAGWRRHRAQPNVVDWHRRWDSEHRRRTDASERFRRWRDGGYQGKPPGRPGGWVQGPRRPNGPARADGQPGRPGWRPHRPIEPITGPQAGPDFATSRPGRPVPTRPQKIGPSDLPVDSAGGAPAPEVVRSGNRPGRPGGYRLRPVRPDVAATPPAPVVTPATPPAAEAPRVDRGQWRGSRPDRAPRPEGAAPLFTRPAQPMPTRPAFTPVPASPAARSTYTPPPAPRAAPAARSAPAPRAAPPPHPSKIDRSGDPAP